MFTETRQPLRQRGGHTPAQRRWAGARGVSDAGGRAGGWGAKERMSLLSPRFHGGTWTSTQTWTLRLATVQTLCPRPGVGGPRREPQEGAPRCRGFSASGTGRNASRLKITNFSVTPSARAPAGATSAPGTARPWGLGRIAGPSVLGRPPTLPEARGRCGGRVSIREAEQSVPTV